MKGFRTCMIDLTNGGRIIIEVIVDGERVGDEEDSRAMVYMNWLSRID